MNREEIKKIIPHREPMLLVDEAYERNHSSNVRKNRGDFGKKWRCCRIWPKVI